MASKKLSEWLDDKARKFRDTIDRLVDAAGGSNRLQPIPIRVDDAPQRRPRR